MSQVDTNAGAPALPERRIDINPHPPGPPDIAQAQQDPGHQGPGQQDQAQQDPGQQDEIPPGDSDSSGAIFSMYLERAEEEDRKMVESWKGDADGMLVFTGLFSAAVAALLAISVPDIRPNSQDTSAFYLAHIYQQLSESNGTQVTIPSSLSDPTQPFSPPISSLWVNGFWFLSLCISLTCALLSTLLQQWARRYLRVAYPRLSPHKRARIRAFYSEGVVRLRVPYTVEALPALLHLSLFLFFAGLGVFLFSVHLTLFKVVMSWIGLCVVVYAYITFLPIVYKDSPYSAPLSIFASFCLTGLRYGFVRFLDRFPRLDSLIFRRYRNHRTRPGHPENFFSHSMSKTAENFALQMGPDIDYRAFSWTFESLDEDNELEKFFEGVPEL
ncbi:hypothetical protein BC827DRAFT_520274 [Russula dissimulans]|nr:hypothetical protein BC827DRAFT_520274 [Russula dissimulans]